MTTTRIYRSTDSSAPVLTGQASSLIDLLDACLVNGYGAKTAAGWTKPYTGTNKAAFRNSVAAGGTGMYLRVLDNGSGTGGAREALVRCYLTMSDVDTGTIETPTVAQLAASIVWRKSNSADSTARAWVLVADELTMYLTTDDGYAPALMAAGDIVSYVPGDAYGYFIAGRSSQAGASSYGTGRGLVLRSVSWATPTASGLYLARGFAGSGYPVAAAVPTLASTSTSAGQVIGGGGSSQIAAPAPGTALDMWIPAWVQSEGTVRGHFPGLFVPLHSMDGVAQGTDYPDPPGLPSGAVLTTLRNKIGASDDGHLCVESALPWR